VKIIKQPWRLCPVWGSLMRRQSPACLAESCVAARWLSSGTVSLMPGRALSQAQCHAHRFARPPTACLAGEWGIVSTPKGMRRASWSQWGNLRHSTNVAFFSLLYAKELPKGTPVGGRAALRCFNHWHAASTARLQHQ
jgi:hypothetical protein